MKARPSFQFYPADWLRDPGLRSCSLAARGLWMDMLCFMHEAEPYGHLRLNSQDLTLPVLARMVGAARREVRMALAELEHAGVFSKNDQGTIFSRRMIRDEELRKRRAQGGIKALENVNVPRPKGREEGYPSGHPSDGPSPPSFDPSPSSSSSSSSSSSEKKEEKRAGSASPSPADGTPKTRKLKLADSDFIAELKRNPAYQGIDIDREIGKLKAWLATPKGHGKQLTRSRLVNWLNKVDVPLNGHANGKATTATCQWPVNNGLKSGVCGTPVQAGHTHCEQHEENASAVNSKRERGRHVAA